MNTREFAKMFRKTCPPGRYCLERYGKPWRWITVSDREPGEVPLVDCVAAAPVPGLVVGKVEPLKAPVGDTVKLADLLARGRATVSQGPADNPPPAVKARVPAEWRAWSVERRRRWLKVNRLDLTRGEDCEERITEWVEAG